jgi:uncharacterized protein (DUF1778 family)
MARDQELRFRVTKAERQAVVRAAEKEERVLSDFLRRLVLKGIGYKPAKNARSKK